MIEQHPLLIGGAWVRGESQQVNENPSDLHSPVGEFDVASTDHVDLAVEAALAAFPVWAREPSHRVECLDQIGKRLWAERERLGTVLSAEEGKPLREGIGEVVRASKTFSYYAHQVMSAQGDVLPSGRSRVQIHTRRRPLGVVAVISPWNFPIAVPAWKIAPALAAGNSVVFKAAESVPASAWELARVIHESGVPAGTFNFVTGKGSVVGERLANHEQIAALTFTGSTKVGQHLLSTAHASSNLRVQAEMGGKNPLIITEDASIDHAVSVTLDSCYGSTGQRCTASSRIIVESGILDEFVERLAHRMNELRVGHALDAQTDIGPVANASQLRVNLDAIELGL